MIHYEKINGKTEKFEIVIADSIRAKIMNHLKIGKKQYFNEIVEALGKNDIIVSRELKKLVEFGWILHEGKRTPYNLDMSNSKVQEYLNKLSVAIPPNSEITEVKTEILTPFKNRFNKGKSDNDIQWRANASEVIIDELPIKEEIANYILPYINVVVAGEKIEDYNEKKEITLTSTEYIELAYIINRIISKRSWYYLRRECKNNPDYEKNKVKLYREDAPKLRQQSWKKPLKLIVSYPLSFKYCNCFSNQKGVTAKLVLIVSRAS